MRIRDYLERNKIFFETVAASLLSIMAVIVAVVQTDLLKLQTRVAEVQVLPQFEIIHFAGNDATNSWVVSNEGAPIRDLEFTASCFLVVKGTPRNAQAKAVRLPVHDCIGGWGASWGGKGKLAEVVGLRKASDVRLLEDRIVDEASRNGWRDTTSTTQMIVRLKYRDLLNRTHEEFYEASGFANGRLMDPDEASVLFKRWRVVSDRFSFNELSAERVVLLVAQAANGEVLRDQ